jgi:hypothetical protein
MLPTKLVSYSAYEEVRNLRQRTGNGIVLCFIQSLDAHVGHASFSLSPFQFIVHNHTLAFPADTSSLNNLGANK